MNSRVVPIVLLAAFAVLIGVFAKGLNPDRNKNELPSAYLERQAPAFDLPSLTRPGERVSTDDFAGEMVLVNVWATWCEGCRLEHPYLMELAATGEIPIYGINWRDNREQALVWLDRFGDPYVDSAFDADARVGIDWGVYAAPETFLVDGNRVVLKKHLGPMSPAVWEEKFLPVIEANGGAE
ncbi:MAG: DsbE family thiol:disulfide interchange protein [Woeseiaceae bacterium]|nr:DsbE family thiol:disulfide interchange protein [Woeseiaceae bacterium]